MRIRGAAATTVPVQTAESSLIFNDDDSAYLSKTYSGTGNLRAYTFSCWVKLSHDSSGGISTLLSAGSATTAGSDYTTIGFGGNKLLLIGGGTPYFVSDASYMDTAAWYHIVLTWDSDNATADQRVRFYVNSYEITGTRSNPAQFTDSIGINESAATDVHGIGAHRYNNTEADIFDGYMAEATFIDGQVLDPTNFGEFDLDGVWQPKDTSGLTFGGNSFRLNFADSGDLGNDVSGANNDWTSNNLAADDQVIDIPSDNYATLNSLALNAVNTISNGNKTIAGYTALSSAYGTIGVSSGKWYWEYTVGGSNAMLGIAQTIDPEEFPGGDADAWARDSGQLYNNGSGSAYGTTYTNGDVIAVVLDLDAGTLRFRNNDVDEGEATTGLSGTFVPIFRNHDSGVSTVNFGQTGFTYTPPSGFIALSTANLPTVTITNPSEYFNSIVYAGNGSTQSITGVGFQPDLVWSKATSSASGHALYDAVRGVNILLGSQSTAGDATKTDGLTSFDVDGFSVGADTAPSGGTINASGDDYVAWNWKANGSGVSNTDGSITSTVSANTTSGFSIVSYSGTGANATVGHGLGVAPKFVIGKQRNAADQWVTWHDGFTGDEYQFLNTAAAKGTLATVWNSTVPSSTVISLGTDGSLNESASTNIMYCFAEVEGFSKFGTYIGNGVSDGPFVYCGFKPAYIMVKTNDADNWTIFDIARDTYNTVSSRIYANDTSAEVVSGAVDFVSNGFKIQTSGFYVNRSATDIIFAAFAETPFKLTRAR